MPGVLCHVTEEARGRVLELMRAGGSAPERAMWLEITGAADGEYTFDITLRPRSTARSDDSVEQHGDLVVIVPAASIDQLRGATVGWDDGPSPGLTLDNPNRPAAPVDLPMLGVVQAGGSPQLEPSRAGTLAGSVAERVNQVLERVVNPGIAAHGGRAELAAIEDGVAYLRLGGGCQGCGMAEVTLTQGIEESITRAVPEVSRVVDVTDHASGTNPYYEPAHA